MKNKLLVIVVILFVGLLVVGCKVNINISPTSKTNDSEKTTKKTDSSDLVGRWAYSGGMFIYTFNSDMTGEYNVAGTIMKFTYTVDGNKLSILYDDMTETFDTTYKIEGDTLIIKDSLGEDVKYKKQ